MRTRAANLGLLLGVALILSYVESLIPFAFGIPGMKLGLPNAAILIVLYLYGWQQALIINVLRIVVSGFLFGSMFGILFSLAGAIISFFVMCIFKKADFFSIKGVSICGGVGHNIGQMLVAVYVVKTSGILYYLPVLMIGGLITGILIGIISENIIPRIRSEVIPR
jgi:heptaprenyl diphosphate synthase